MNSKKKKSRYLAYFSLLQECNIHIPIFFKMSSYFGDIFRLQFHCFFIWYKCLNPLKLPLTCVNSLYNWAKKVVQEYTSNAVFAQENRIKELPGQINSFWKNFFSWLRQYIELSFNGHSSLRLLVFFFFFFFFSIAIPCLVCSFFVLFCFAFVLFCFAFFFVCSFVCVFICLFRIHPSHFCPVWLWREKFPPKIQCSSRRTRLPSENSKTVHKS